MATEMASHILLGVWLQLHSDFVTFVNIFMESSDHEEIPLCKILYFVTGTTGGIIRYCTLSEAWYCSLNKDGDAQ
jgi:hypothetical protein